MEQREFTFAGRLVTVQDRGLDATVPDSTKVFQERLLIDSVATGQETGLRMRGWPVGVAMRSPHWFSLVRFTDRATGDSTVWFARRLQPADSVRPRFEIIRIDARGRYEVETRDRDELRSEYRVARVTQFLAEDAPSGFPFSMIQFLFFPVLLLLHPIGTVLLGVRLVRVPKDSRKDARAAV
jgi:hypothetical protein